MVKSIVKVVYEETNEPKNIDNTKELIIFMSLG